MALVAYVIRCDWCENTMDAMKETFHVVGGDDVCDPCYNDDSYWDLLRGKPHKESDYRTGVYDEITGEE